MNVVPIVIKTWPSDTCYIAAAEGGPDPAGKVYMLDNANNEGVCASLIDYRGDQPVIVRVRNLWILPFESHEVITSEGLQVTPARVLDRAAMRMGLSISGMELCFGRPKPMHNWKEEGF